MKVSNRSNQFGFGFGFGFDKVQCVVGGSTKVRFGILFFSSLNPPAAHAHSRVGLDSGCGAEVTLRACAKSGCFAGMVKAALNWGTHFETVPQAKQCNVDATNRTVWVRPIVCAGPERRLAICAQ